MRRMDAGLNEASTSLAHEFVALAATVEAVEAEATLGFIIFKKASHRPALPHPRCRGPNSPCSPGALPTCAVL